MICPKQDRSKESEYACGFHRCILVYRGNFDKGDFMSKRKAAVYLLVAVFILAPFGLLLYGYLIYGGTSKEIEQITTYDKHYAMITGSEDSGLWDAIYASAKAEGEKRGIYVERFGSSLAVKYDTHQLMKMAVQASVDGIIVRGDETEETIACINTAIDNDIPVVTVFNDCSGSKRQCFVGTNNYHVGQEYGRQIQNLLKENEKEGTKKVLVLTEDNPNDTSRNLILLGIRETLETEIEETHEVTVEAAQVDNSGSFSAEEYIRDVFLDAEQIPDILVCLSEVYTQCAYQAAVDYNKVGAVQLLGYYDSDQILDALAKNIVTVTITPDTKQMGRSCVEALDEYEQTGYTNGYTAVDVQLIRPKEAKERLKRKQQE